MKITSKSPRLQVIEENQGYNINYGSIKKGSDTKVEILIEDIDHLSVSKSCGCTAPTVEILNNGIILKIVYDNKKVGTINQWVKERVKLKSGEQKIIQFNLKGQIV